MFPLGIGVTNKTVLVLPKADLLSGSVADATLFQGIPGGATGFSLQPAVDQGGGGLPAHFLSAYSDGLLRVSSISGFPDIDSPVLSSNAFLAVTSLGNPPGADQPGAPDLDTGSNRFGGNVVLVDGQLWAVQGVATGPAGAAVRWFRIDPVANSVLESGVISDADLDLFYPSIAVNDNGDVVIGFSGSGEDTYAGSYAIVGSFDGTTTTFGDLMLLAPGSGPYVRTRGSGDTRNRWGDYSATVVDPTDPTRFWTFQEIAIGGNDWGIRITELIVPDPIPEPGTLALTGLGLPGLGIAVYRRRRSA